MGGELSFDILADAFNQQDQPVADTGLWDQLGGIGGTAQEIEASRQALCTAINNTSLAIAITDGSPISLNELARLYYDHDSRISYTQAAVLNIALAGAILMAGQIRVSQMKETYRTDGTMTRRQFLKRAARAGVAVYSIAHGVTPITAIPKVYAGDPFAEQFAYAVETIANPDKRFDFATRTERIITMRNHAMAYNIQTVNSRYQGANMLIYHAPGHMAVQGLAESPPQELQQTLFGYADRLVAVADKLADELKEEEQAESILTNILASYYCLFADCLVIGSDNLTKANNQSEFGSSKYLVFARIIDQINQNPNLSQQAKRALVLAMEQDKNRDRVSLGSVKNHSPRVANEFSSNDLTKENAFDRDDLYNRGAISFIDSNSLEIYAGQTQICGIITVDSVTHLLYSARDNRLYYYDNSSTICFETNNSRSCKRSNQTRWAF